MRDPVDGRTQIASTRKPTAIAVGFLLARAGGMNGTRVYYRNFARRVQLNSNRRNY
jgi:hypothetical protein